MELNNRKGVFFSIDALIATGIIIIVLIVSYPLLVSEVERESNIQQDLIESLSSVSIGEVNNTAIQSHIFEGKENDTSLSVLEYIGKLYVENVTLAKEITQDILNDIDPGENLGIWYGSTLVGSVNDSSMEESEYIITSRQLISGIQEGGTVTGFSARAFLSSSLDRKYFLLGGYIGDGNISVIVDYNGTINSANMEIAINGPYDLYINGVLVGSYNSSVDKFTPYKVSIPIGNFTSGKNNIELKGEKLSVAGGYIEVLYEPSDIVVESHKYYFPGVTGLINLYDGFFVPGNLTNLEVFLHLDTNLTAFLNIGNVSVYRNITSGEESFTLSDAYLSSILDYDELSKKTIPLRLGLENISYTGEIAKKVDTFSVTDISGSMGECIEYSSPMTCNYGCFWGGSKSCSIVDPGLCGGNVCGGTCFIPFGHNVQTCLKTKLDAAIESNYLFIDAVLNVSGNNLGVLGYENGVSSSDFYPLTNISSYLKNTVSSWTEGSSTAICEGINSATAQIVVNATGDNVLSMVVMSDGQANVECVQQNTGSASSDAIQAACDAYENYGITVHAIGFGADVDEVTMQQIALCGNGNYYYADVEELSDIYSSIAETILLSRFSEQTLNITGGEVLTKLYSDSYIEYDYLSEDLPFGIQITSEEPFYDEINANFSAPDNSTIVDAKVISYSGPRWTSYVEANGNEVYNLSRYGDLFIELGDPYAVNIPVELLQENNSIRLETGIAPDNSTVGSISNKVIYTAIKSFSAYSDISPFVDGCVWTIEFQDSSYLNVSIPSSYSGSDSCYYTSLGQSYDINDAADGAAFELLKVMDLDLDHRVDVKFSEEQLNIDITEINGIPYSWSTEVQVRTWY